MKFLLNLFRTFLNLMWLCTQTYHTFFVTFLEHCTTWLGFTPKPPRFFGTLLIFDLILHQNLPEPSPKSSPESYWTWFFTKASRLSPESFPEPCWTLLYSAPNTPIIFPESFLEPFPEPCWTWLCIKSFPGPFLDSCWTLPGFVLKFPEFFAGIFMEPCWNWSGIFSEPRWILVNIGAILDWRPD
jgi:hypothetical protein